MNFLRTVLYVVVAILVSTGVFAAAYVHRYGWDAATDNGLDPWALFFFGIGDAFLPLAVATVMAGIRKLLDRETSFLTDWLVTVAIITVLFAALYLYVGAKLN